MWEALVCFQHKPLATHDSSVAGRYLLSRTYTVIPIVTTSRAQEGKKESEVWSADLSSTPHF